MKRNILDYLGNIIGELELPDDTPEQIWQQRLAKYALPPIVETQLTHIEKETWTKADKGFELYLKLVAVLDSAGGTGSVDASLQVYAVIQPLRCLLKDGFFGMAYRYYCVNIAPLNIMPEELENLFKEECAKLILDYGGNQSEINSYEEV